MLESFGIMPAVIALPLKDPLIFVPTAQFIFLVNSFSYSPMKCHYTQAPESTEIFYRHTAQNAADIICGAQEKQL